MSFNKTERVTKPNLRKTQKFQIFNITKMDAGIPRRASPYEVFKLTQRKRQRKRHFVHQRYMREVANASVEVKTKNEILI